MSSNGIVSKTCRTCKAEKPILEFYKNGNRGHRYPDCRDCHKPKRLGATKRWRQRQTQKFTEDYYRLHGDHARTCDKCGEVKRNADFPKNRNTADGYVRECRPCRAAIRRRVGDARIVATDGEKRCSRCVVVKPMDGFPVERIRRDGRKAMCRECCTESSLASHLLRKYGLSLSQYRALLGSQGGRCAICLREPNQKSRLHVDHCHGTGAVRGLLCSDCNTAIGLLRDKGSVCRRAADYIDNNQ